MVFKTQISIIAHSKNFKYWMLYTVFSFVNSGIDILSAHRTVSGSCNLAAIDRLGVDAEKHAPNHHGNSNNLAYVFSQSHCEFMSGIELPTANPNSFTRLPAKSLHIPEDSYEIYNEVAHKQSNSS